MILDGKELISGTLTDTNPIDGKASVTKDKILYKDDYLFYELYYSMVRKSTQMRLRSGYTAFMDAKRLRGIR